MTDWCIRAQMLSPVRSLPEARSCVASSPARCGGPPRPSPVCVMESAGKKNAACCSLAARALQGKGIRDQGARGEER